MARRETNPWREYKRIRKDKAKINRYRSYGWLMGKHFKNHTNRKWRRSINRKIILEDWDNWLDFPPDYYENPWRWD